GEGLEGRHRDGFAFLEFVQAGHAHQARLPVHLGGAGTAFAGLAVPPAGQVGGLGSLDAVDDVQDHHAGIRLHGVVLELAAFRVTPVNFEVNLTHAATPFGKA